MPLQRRLPKFGFKNFNRVEYQAVNVYTLQRIAETFNVTEITPEVLDQYGVASAKSLIKVLGDGELKAKLVVKANAFSKKAEEAIVAAGGSVEKL